MSEQRKGRRPGSRNRRPGKEEIDGYMTLLRDRAQAGDVHAAGYLVQIHIQDEAARARGEHARAG